MGYSENKIEGHKETLQRKKWISNLIPFALAAILTFITMKIFKFDFPLSISPEELFERIWPIARWPAAIILPFGIFFASVLPKKIRTNLWLCLFLCYAFFILLFLNDDLTIQWTSLVWTTLCFCFRKYFSKSEHSQSKKNADIDLN